MPDLKVIGQQGSTVYLLFPASEAGRQWIDEKVAVVTRFGNGVAVEHRYIDSIAAGALEDGLEVEFNS